MGNGTRITAKAGERVRLYCLRCSTRYDLTHEPTIAENGTQAEVGDAEAQISYCPYCGSEDIEAD